MEMEILTDKIEEEGALIIPKYVYDRVEKCIREINSGCSEADINRACKELKEAYGKMSGGSRPENLYGSLCHVIAYLRYYFFLNYPAIRWILLNCLDKGMEIIPRQDSVRVLDYGAGPGTASIAVCDFLEDAEEIGIYENTKVKLYFDEKIGDFAICYRKMLSKHRKAASIDYVYEKDENWKINYYDIVIISYVLSELDENMQQWLITNVHNCLKDNGFLVIIEPAYKGMRKFIGSFLKDRLIRSRFKVIDASGPLCCNELCIYWGECYADSIKRRELRTPEGMTEEMKRFFEGEKKKGRIKWVYAVLKKVPDQEGYLDPSELKGYYGSGRKFIRLRGWVIDTETTDPAENITFCNGLERCNLAFWREKEVFKQVRDISKGDILSVEGKLSRTPFEELSSISVTQIIEHIKRFD
jgi:hypothetical protein